MSEKVPYSKPALSYEAQLQQLKDRGLVISNPEKAIHLLRVVSYYRLSGYWHPLLQEPKTDLRFKEGTTFDQAFDLYCFDRKLRQLVTAELEKIEVAVRAEMSFLLGHAAGPFWYTDPSLFSHRDWYSKTLKKIDHEYQRSDEQFIKQFRSKYSDEKPPTWMVLEICSFGSLSMLYQNLKPGRIKRDIAKQFGLPDRVFGTWLHSLVYIRNVCAHHSRFWNRHFAIKALNPETPSYTWLNDEHSNAKAFFVLSMIVYLLNRINPGHRFIERLDELLTEYPCVDRLALGFPQDMTKELLWNKGSDLRVMSPTT